MNKEVAALLASQCSEWELCRTNYTALQSVEVREVTVSGYNFKIQFNPRRILSSAAKVDAQSISERRCFLCAHNRPSEQKGVSFTAQSGNEYVLLVNPFPIFPKHLTIPSVTHQEQHINGKLSDMLELAHHLDDYLIFYNGPKCGASAPDHFHFQAGNKRFLPLQNDIDNIITEKGILLEQDLFLLNESPAATLIYRSKSTQSIMEWFNRFYKNFAAITGSAEEPMLNLLAWKDGDTYYLVAFPRKAHRPSQYFAEGDENILISPASIDLGGIFITPLEKDFKKITSADIKDILSQITVTPEILKVLTK